MGLWSWLTKGVRNGFHTSGDENKEEQAVDVHNLVCKCSECVEAAEKDLKQGVRTQRNPFRGAY